MQDAGLALTFHEPSIVDILVLGSFLILLNTTRIICDRFIHAGILAEIFIGIFWGAPLGRGFRLDGKKRSWRWAISD